MMHTGGHLGTSERSSSRNFLFDFENGSNYTPKSPAPKVLRRFSSEAPPTVCDPRQHSLKLPQIPARFATPPVRSGSSAIRPSIAPNRRRFSQGSSGICCVLHERSGRPADQSGNSFEVHYRGHTSVAEFRGMDRAMRSRPDHGLLTIRLGKSCRPCDGRPYRDNNGPCRIRPFPPPLSARNVAGANDTSAFGPFIIPYPVLRW
jgi:hypothetical protein